MTCRPVVRVTRVVLVCALFLALAWSSAPSAQDRRLLDANGYVLDEAYPRTTLTGRKFDGNSHHACLEKLLVFMGYDALREDQRRCRARRPRRGRPGAPRSNVASRC